MYAIWPNGTMAAVTQTRRDSRLTHAQNTLFTFHVMLTSGVRDSVRKQWSETTRMKDSAAFRES